MSLKNCNTICKKKEIKITKKIKNKILSIFFLQSLDLFAQFFELIFTILPYIVMNFLIQYSQTRLLTLL